MLNLRHDVWRVFGQFEPCVTVRPKADRSPAENRTERGFFYSSLGGLIPGRLGDAAVGGGKWKPIEWCDRSVG
jgi:hypothetical protein